MTTPLCQGAHLIIDQSFLLLNPGWRGGPIELDIVGESLIPTYMNNCDYEIVNPWWFAL